MKQLCWVWQLNVLLLGKQHGSNSKVTLKKRQSIGNCKLVVKITRIEDVA